MNRFRIVNRYFYKLWIVSQFMKVTIHNSETISELWIVNFLRLTLDECRKQCSEWNLSDEEIKPHNVHYTKTKSDTAVHEQDVFDFFKPTENSLKFKNFLTPTTESNMLKYIARRSNTVQYSRVLDICTPEYTCFVLFSFVR